MVEICLVTNIYFIGRSLYLVESPLLWGDGLSNGQKDAPPLTAGFMKNIEYHGRQQHSPTHDLISTLYDQQPEFSINQHSTTDQPTSCQPSFNNQHLPSSVNSTIYERTTSRPLQTTISSPSHWFLLPTPTLYSEQEDFPICDTLLTLVNYLWHF